MNYIRPTETLVDQLHRYFPDNGQVITELLAEPQMAPIDGMSGESVPYVRLNEGASQPVLYSAGFGESVVNKLSFAVALATSGFDVIMPGQNRSGVMPSKARENMATTTLARNNVAVLRHAGVEEGVDLVGHSFGCLVVPAIVKRLQELGKDMRGSSVALLAPAGVGFETSYINLAHRWLKMQKSEWGQDNKTFPDTTGESGRASLRTLLTNPLQSIAEVRSLRHDRINFAELCDSVGRLAVVCYLDDKMYSEEHIERGLPEAFDAGAIAFSPVSFGTDNFGKLRRMPGAVHDDEQFNPWRVVNPLAQFLHS
jgi:pimeloyl-ACP methyl ester carboxylesterase